MKKIAIALVALTSMSSFATVVSCYGLDERKVVYSTGGKLGTASGVEFSLETSGNKKILIASEGEFVNRAIAEGSSVTYEASSPEAQIRVKCDEIDATLY